MTPEIAEQAKDLLKEIKELKAYKALLEHTRQGHLVHFEIKQHYGECRDSEKVIIDDKHTTRLIVEVKKIIEELEAQLDAL